MTRIYPTLLSIDLLNVEKELEAIAPYCFGFQLDVMDNQFVPHLTYGKDFVNAVATATYKNIWIHLMVEDPNSWLDRFFLPPESIVSFHIESKVKIAETIKRIHEKKWLASIAINPKTPVKEVFPYLPMLHQVLVMSVEPGWASQEFLPESVDKIHALDGYRTTSGLKFRIGIDGGVKIENIQELIKKGVDDIAIGSAIFKSDNPVQALKELNDKAQQAEKEIGLER